VHETDIRVPESKSFHLPLDFLPLDGPAHEENSIPGFECRAQLLVSHWLGMDALHGQQAIIPHQRNLVRWGNYPSKLKATIVCFSAAKGARLANTLSNSRGGDGRLRHGYSSEYSGRLTNPDRNLDRYPIKAKD
jgi:hypothetical protein